MSHTAKLPLVLFPLVLMLLGAASPASANRCVKGDCDNGTGTFRWDNGEKYDGEFRNRKKHGKGTYRYADGNRYSGEWENDVIQGFGEFRWKNGNRYVGRYTNNRMNGKGTFFWADGKKYEGELKDNMREGRGILYAAGGSVIHDGLWDTNRFCKVIGTMKFLYLDGGEFLMGSAEGDGVGNERPRHSVKVDGFWIGKYEVTQEEYAGITGKNPSSVKGGLMPVDSLSHGEAVDFCGKFGEKFNVRARLPYEAEWEYAVRAGSGTRYFWGDEIDGACAWYDGNSDFTMHPVGLTRPNAWGLCDMTGNVWEMVMDYYDEEYYAQSPVNNPKGPLEGIYRVKRGGSCINSGKYVRIAIRDRLPLFKGEEYTGFRVVLH